MAGPDVVYVVHSAGVDTTNLVTSTLSPTPVNNDILIVKLCTWDTANPMGAVTGGGQTYTVGATQAPGGFNGWSQVVYCIISGSPAAFAVTGAGTASNSRHSMVVEHYKASSGFNLAVSPAVGSSNGVASAPSTNITTVGTGSVVSFSVSDAQSVDPATRTYRLSATEETIWDGHVGSNGVFYFAYATVGAPSTYAMGLTAPGGQTWVQTGIEVQVSGGGAVVTPSPVVVPPAAVTRASTW